MDSLQSVRTFLENPRKSRVHKFRGFTLVELIVVITILAILGTIAFVSISGFSGSARDSSRVSDLSNISKSLDITFINTGWYPAPDNSFSVTYSGSTIWTQGTVGDTVMNILNAGGARINKKPTDPLSSSKEYIYSKLAYGSAFQIRTDYENDTVSFGNNRSYFLDQAEASTGNPLIAYVKGNYNGMVAKTETGSTKYLLAIPSLFINKNTGTVALSATTATGFYLHGRTNSGGILFTPALVYSSGSLPVNSAEALLFASGIIAAYSGTTLADNANASPFISASTNTGTLASLGSTFLNANLGGSAPASPPSPSNAFISANGGTITYSGNYKIHTFTSNGTFQVTSGTGVLEYLVVAGGGGGGGAVAGGLTGGGGGGGGLLNSTGATTLQSYAITVGAGGAGGTNASTSGTQGGNSSIIASGWNVVAIGGGSGGFGRASGFGDNGGPGGSGGGNGWSPPGTPTPASGTSGQGYSSVVYNVGGAGAGGAGAGGANNMSAGGAGLAVWGTTYAAGGSNNCGTVDINPPSRTSNTGNGGYGGWGSSSAVAGGTGGSGIVVIRYLYQ